MAADDVRRELTEIVEARLPRLAPRTEFEWQNTADDLVHRLMPVVDRIAREAAGKAWDEGYAAGWRDTEEQPYSDHPARKTWRPQANPHRAEAADGGEGR